MKIKNDYIKIVQGDKEIKLNNYIYDDYLSLFSTTQYNVDSSRVQDLLEEIHEKEMSFCLLRFDESLEDITNAHSNDFQFFIKVTQENFTGFRNGISILYNYHFDEGIDINSGSLINKEEYYGKKITALAFGKVDKINACLDVSNYEIYVLEDENLTLTRKDSFSTDGIVFGYDFPVHLSPIGDRENSIFNADFEVYEDIHAKLYSIGFAKALGVTSEEYIINEDISIKIIDDKSFSFNLKKGDDVSLYPNTTLYTSDNLYPLPLYVQHEFYPQNNLYASNDLYPSDSNYKYIFYKYKLYTIHQVPEYQGSYIINELDEYYTLFLENTTKGLFEIITKIERNDE